MVFDELQLFFGRDYKINDYITIKHPKLKEICDFGEQEYYSLVCALTAIPSYYKVQLFDAGHDYETISDFNFFYTMCKNLPEGSSSMFFDKLELSAIEPAVRKDNQETIYYDPVNDVIIDESSYIIIAEYLRTIHGLVKKVEKAGNAKSKRWFIERDRRKMERVKDKPFKSQLKPIVSALVNCEKFKYNHTTVLDLPIYVIHDSLNQINRSISFDHLMQGVYAGTVDFKQLSSDSQTWIENLD